MGAGHYYKGQPVGYIIQVRRTILLMKWVWININEVDGVIIIIFKARSGFLLTQA